MNETRNDYISYISDTYKDIHGIRPRFYNFDQMTLEELKAEANQLEKQVIADMNHERDEKQAHEQAVARAMAPAVPWTLDMIFEDADRRHARSLRPWILE